jgi:hypothetical protein
MDLPDASADRARQARIVSDLWHGARAANGGCCRRSRSGTRGHGTSVLDRVGADTAAAGLRHGCYAARPAASTSDRRPSVGMAPVRPRHAGGPLGRLAVLRARMGIDRKSQPQHVHADRARHRDGVRLQRRWYTRAPAVPGLVPDPRKRGRALLRGGGCNHSSRTARAGPRATCTQPNEQCDQGAAPPGAADCTPAPA